MFLQEDVLLIEFEGKWCNNSVIVWGTHPDTDFEIGLSSLTENIGKTMLIISRMKEYREKFYEHVLPFNSNTTYKVEIASKIPQTSTIKPIYFTGKTLWLQMLPR